MHAISATPGTNRRKSWAGVPKRANAKPQSRARSRSAPAGKSCHSLGLNPQQVAALNIITGVNKNVVLHGGPGTGKSFVALRAVEAALEQGHVCFVIAPLARVLQVFRKLQVKYPRSLRVCTWHSLLNEIKETASVMPSAGFTSAVKRGVPRVSPSSRTGLGYLFVDEYIGLTAQMLEKAVNSLRACQTFTYVAGRFTGDPGQLLPPTQLGSAAVSSRLFMESQCKVVTLEQTERFKQCKKLEQLTLELRDVRAPVAPWALDMIEDLCEDRPRGQMTVCARHKTVSAVRRRLWQKHPEHERISITPVPARPAKGTPKPSPCLLALGEPVIVTENTWLDKSKEDTTAGRPVSFVANGTMGTLADWSWRRTGLGQIDATDPLAEWVEIALESSGEKVKFKPTVRNGYTQFALAYGRVATIHSMQGRTFKGTLTVDTTGSPPATACRALSVGVSRALRLCDVNVVVDNVDALRRRYSVDEDHDRVQIALHNTEEALRVKRTGRARP
ncbi:MAG: AAA family ATPase [Limisphaerales bacterium]